MSDKLVIQIDSSRKIETVELPSFPGSEVKVLTQLTLGDMREIAAEEDDISRVAIYCTKAVVDWNIHKSEDEKHPIEKDTFLSFSQDDVFTILAAATGRSLEDIQSGSIEDIASGKK